MSLKTLYPIALTQDEAVEEAGGDRSQLSREFLTEEIVADAQAAYAAREEDLGSEVMRELERRVLLSVLDRKWREHLYEMDYLQEGIGMRALAQRDPLVEYQREGFDMFAAMMEAIKEESVGFLFNLDVEVEDGADGATGGSAPVAISANGAAPQAGASAEATDQASGGGLPGIDLSLLEEAEAEHAKAKDEPAEHPTIRAKGLDRSKSSDSGLTYSAPELGSDGPTVTTDASKNGTSAGRPRTNPNRGSRGNKSSRSRSTKGRRR